MVEILAVILRCLLAKARDGTRDHFEAYLRSLLSCPEEGKCSLTEQHHSLVGGTVYSQVVSEVREKRLLAFTFLFLITFAQGVLCRDGGVLQCCLRSSCGNGVLFHFALCDRRSQVLVRRYKCAVSWKRWLFRVVLRVALRSRSPFPFYIP